MKKQKRQVIKQLLQCVAIVTVGTLAIILFMFVIWNDSRGRRAYNRRTGSSADAAGRAAGY